MPSLREVTEALYGAWRLLRFDAGGMNWFDISITGFWRSFFAAVLVAPGYAVMMGIALAVRDEAVDPGRAILVASIAYVLGWAAFPVVAMPLTRLLSLTHRYFHLVISTNWTSVPQMLIILPAVVVEASGVLPRGSGTLLTMAATLFALFYEWFVVRTALETTSSRATGIVIVQVIINELVHLGAFRLI